MTAFRSLRASGLAISAALALAACSERQAAPVPSEPAAPAQPAPPPPGGLEALSQADVATADLGGELGCSFASTAGGPPLLVAMGVVASNEPARGVLKLSGTIRRVTSPGGFDAMLKGATFSGEGATARVAVTGPSEGGGESPPSPATLTVEIGGETFAPVVGRWSCGP